MDGGLGVTDIRCKSLGYKWVQKKAFRVYRSYSTPL